MSPHSPQPDEKPITPEEYRAWEKVSAKLGRDLARMDAYRSGNLTFRDGGVFLDNGEPATPEIMRALGWTILDGET
jgi:hypothetical protein